MKIIQRIIYSGFAVVAVASASMPAFPGYTIGGRPHLQGPDFEWYANVGRPDIVVFSVAAQPPAREGFIWSPQRWEWNGRNHVWVEGRWIRDDFAEQVALYNFGAPATLLAERAPPPRQIIIERR
jgi:WXXGXW repeat (2 copies)